MGHRMCNPWCAAGPPHVHSHACFHFPPGCPAQVWVTIASKLNWDIVQLNKGSSGKGGKQK